MWCIWYNYTILYPCPLSRYIYSPLALPLKPFVPPLPDPDPDPLTEPTAFSPVERSFLHISISSIFSVGLVVTYVCGKKKEKKIWASEFCFQIPVVTYFNTRFLFRRTSPPFPISRRKNCSSSILSIPMQWVSISPIISNSAWVPIDLAFIGPALNKFFISTLPYRGPCSSPYIIRISHIISPSAGTIPCFISYLSITKSIIQSPAKIIGFHICSMYLVDRNNALNSFFLPLLLTHFERKITWGENVRYPIIVC